MESEEHFQCLKVMNSDNQSLLKHYITWRIKMKSTDCHIATQLGLQRLFGNWQNT